MADEFGELVGEQRADALGAENAGAGGQGEVGEVDEDLGLSRAHLSAGGVSVGVVFDLCEAGVECPLSGTVHRYAVVGFGPWPGNVAHRPSVERITRRIGIVGSDIVVRRSFPQFDGISWVGITGMPAFGRRACRVGRGVTVGRVC